MESSGSFAGVLIAIVILIAIPVFLLRMFLGDKAYQIFKANWVLDITRFIVTAPFRLTAYLFRVIFEAYVKWKSQSSVSGKSFIQFLKKLI